MYMKVVFVGAGSAFGGRVSVDVLSREPLQDSTIALCDIDAGRLETVRSYVQKVTDSNNLDATVLASTDRNELLEDADFILLSVAIGGPAYYDEPFESEMRIPAKYGIVQTVADTMGPGAIFRALRTAPVMLEMIDDINDLAPNATILNYTNPMAILTWLFNERSRVPVVGLCHGVQGNAGRLAKLADVSLDEVRYICAGINHMTWFTKFEHDGVDLLPELTRKIIASAKGSNPYEFRGELAEVFGYYCTESDRHFPEYVPWFQNGERERFTPHIERTMGIKGKRQHWYEDMGVAIEQAESVELIRSHEWASAIMDSMVTGSPRVFSGNVMNRGCMDNLPAESCVEVPCTVDGNGISPHRVGSLPLQCAALCKSNIIMQELCVEAIRLRSKDAAFRALLMDPITQANVTIAQAKSMFDELWKAEGDLLDVYS
jgi:alpha-galactosidase